MLLPSRLGWVLSGIRSGISVNVAAVNFLHLQVPGPLPETELKGLWDLETIGITAHHDEFWDAKDLAVLQAFHYSLRIQNSWSRLSTQEGER